MLAHADLDPVGQERTLPQKDLSVLNSFQQRNTLTGEVPNKYNNSPNDYKWSFLIDAIGRMHKRPK